MSSEQLHLAVVQPRTPRDPDPRESTQRLVFPEGYPGPLRRTWEYDAEPEVAAVARDQACGVCWSRIEQGEGGRWHIVGYLHDREGRRVARYVRVHPATGDVHATLSGIGLHGGDEFVVADFHGVPVGLLICSELWLPEVARTLAVRGAEVLLAPAGGGFGAVTENWRLMTRARAIEDQCYVAMTSHVFGDDAGAALIAGPEAVLAVSDEDELVHGVADLARLRWLRRTDDSMVSPKPFTALPGLLRARRPDRYDELTRPGDGLFDYERPDHTPVADR